MEITLTNIEYLHETNMLFANGHENDRELRVIGYKITFLINKDIESEIQIDTDEGCYVGDNIELHFDRKEYDELFANGFYEDDCKEWLIQNAKVFDRVKENAFIKELGLTEEKIYSQFGVSKELLGNNKAEIESQYKSFIDINNYIAGIDLALGKDITVRSRALGIK